MVREPVHPWTLDALAATAAASRASLVRAFRAAAGVAPLEFLTDLRLGLAHHRLRTETVSLDRLAAEVGYQSAAALSRAFLRKYGIRPGQAGRPRRRRRVDPRGHQPAPRGHRGRGRPDYLPRHHAGGRHAHDRLEHLPPAGHRRRRTLRQAQPRTRCGATAPSAPQGQKTGQLDAKTRELIAVAAVAISCAATAVSRSTPTPPASSAPPRPSWPRPSGRHQPRCRLPRSSTRPARSTPSRPPPRRSPSPHPIEQGVVS